jgi:hypothetical protein
MATKPQRVVSSSSRGENGGGGTSNSTPLVGVQTKPFVPTKKQIEGQAGAALRACNPDVVSSNVTDMTGLCPDDLRPKVSSSKIDTIVRAMLGYIYSIIRSIDADTQPLRRVSTWVDQPPLEFQFNCKDMCNTLGEVSNYVGRTAFNEVCANLRRVGWTVEGKGHVVYCTSK